MNSLSISWQITAKCSNNCLHCFEKDKKTYFNEIKNSLPLNKMIAILDQIDLFSDKYDVEINQFKLTGGDPLLKEDWEDFFLELKKRNKIISLAANPETLTPLNLIKLKNCNIEKIQLSLDGLKKIHDQIRSKGSFQRTIKAINLLDEYGFYPHIRFTLFEYNSNQLIPLVNYLVNHTKIKSFIVALGLTVGNAAKTFKSTLSNTKKLLLFKDFFEAKKQFSDKDIEIKAHPLLEKFIQYDKKKINPTHRNSYPAITGCKLGFNFPNILADGTLLPCAFMHIPIGKLPEDSLEEVFLKNTLLKKFRRTKYSKSCKNCDWYLDCRGCAAETYAKTNDPFEKRERCFKDQISHRIGSEMPFINEPSLNTTLKEEWDFLNTKKHFSPILEKGFKNENFINLFYIFFQNNEIRKKFIKNPSAFLKTNNIKLGSDLKNALTLYFKNERILGKKLSKDSLKSLFNILYC